MISDPICIANDAIEAESDESPVDKKVGFLSHNIKGELLIRKFFQSYSSPKDLRIIYSSGQQLPCLRGITTSGKHEEHAE